MEDENGTPSITGEVEGVALEDRAKHMRCARVYYKVCSAFKHWLSQCMNKKAIPFYHASSLQTGT